MLQTAKIILFNIALIYVCIVAGLYMVQRTMIFFPNTPQADIPERLTKKLKLFEKETSDGLTLTGLYAFAEGNKPTMVFFHGNASNHSMNVYIADYYIEQGYGFLSAGYRGYNGDPGKPFEHGFYKDARTWMSYLLEEQKIKPSNIVLYGQSIGTGVATQMATEFPDVKALILESPYTSLPDVAAKQFFFIPVHLLMKDKFENLKKLEQLTVPLFIIQGKQDNVIPTSHGKKIFDRYNGTKDMVVFDNAGHNDIPREDATKAVTEFLK